MDSEPPAVVTIISLAAALALTFLICAALLGLMDALNITTLCPRVPGPC